MKSTGYLYALGAAVTWGIVYTIDQKILSGVSPFALLFVDSLLTTALLLPFAVFERRSLMTIAHSTPKMWALIALSLALAAVAGYLIFASIKIVGASTASVFEIVYPFFVVLFTAIVMRAVPNVYFLIGAALVFAGVLVIIKYGSPNIEPKVSTAHPRAMKQHRAIVADTR